MRCSAAPRGVRRMSAEQSAAFLIVIALVPLVLIAVTDFVLRK
jgi:hypothetical protein